MDPDQTYEDFLEALAAGDVEVASHRLDELAAWVRRGGFAPKKLARRVSDPAELGHTLMHATLALVWAANDLNTKERRRDEAVE